MNNHRVEHEPSFSQHKFSIRKNKEHMKQSVKMSNTHQSQTFVHPNSQTNREKPQIFLEKV